MVSDIDNGEFGIDLKQNALERADQVVVAAVVGGQRNDWISHYFSRLICRLIDSLAQRKTLTQ